MSGVKGGGKRRSFRTAASTAGLQLPSRGDCAGGGMGQGVGNAALLVPQDGVLVVELQVLHGGAAGLFSAAVFVFHNLKGLLHFSVSEIQNGK